MIWSALSLIASLLLCAAVILGPVATGDFNSRSSGLSQRAKTMKPRAKDMGPVASVGRAIDGFELGEDAPVVRVSTESR